MKRMVVVLGLVGFAFVIQTAVAIVASPILASRPTTPASSGPSSPTLISPEIATEPTLARRIAKAFEIDPAGWTADRFVATWRGGLKVWIGNQAPGVGSAYARGDDTADWPLLDPRFDDDRATVWAAYERWRASQADTHNEAAFAALGPAPEPAPSNYVLGGVFVPGAGVTGAPRVEWFVFDPRGVTPDGRP